MPLPATQISARPRLEPAGQVNGDTLRVVAATLRMPQQARELLVRHGLPPEPQPGEWYSLAAWLRVLADIEQQYGRHTLYAAGLQAVHQCVWPEGLQSLEQAFSTLNTALRANIRGADVGHYRVEPAGLREWYVECETPAPYDYEYGIITGLARWLKPNGAVRVKVIPADAAETGAKRFRVSW